VVSDVLDDADGVAVMGEQPYLLEVSSPGTDRPLTEPKHWRRAKSRLVKAILKNGGDVAGRVLSSDEEGVLLEVPGKKKGTTAERRLAYAEIAKARVEIEFSRKDEDTDELHGVEDLEVEDLDDAESAEDHLDQDEEG
jgi:ribosome maturation factor RimP